MTSLRHDLGRPVAVSAGELLVWARLAGDLAAWLTCPAPPVKADHQQRFPHGPTLPEHAWALHHLNERVHALLNPDHG